MTRTGPILVAGHSGRLARALVEEAAALGLPLRALGRPDLDIEDPDSIRRVMAAETPIAIINAAGLVIVDEAERAPDRAYAINRDGAVALAMAAASAGIPYLHVSSDYVFDGGKRAPYVETDPAFPVSIYGKSKVAGEQGVLAAYPSAIVVRTSWVFGPQGTSFVTAMLRLARTQEVVQVVADQHGSPTAAPDLARALLDITTQLLRPETENRGGIYHVAGSGETTWFHLAEAIFSRWAARGHRVPRIEPMSSAQWPGPAQRPSYSVLDCAKVKHTFGIRLPPWQESLELCVAALDRRDGERP